jgi:hypothetical protein
MNAPLPDPNAAALGDLEEFAECCEVHAWFFAEGWISLQTTVDNLQSLAERWHLVEEYGQEAIQALMAFSAVPEEVPSDYAAQIVRQWEIADARDRWQHTGELPPAPAAIPNAVVRSRGVPTSTIEAFKYIVSVGNPDHLAKWLRDHSGVAAALLKEVA